LEDAAAREVRWLAAEEKKKKKKDEEKKWACKKMLARNALEKCRRAQAREGLPLEASPSTEEDDNDDDDGEGMEVCMGLSPRSGFGPHWPWWAPLAAWPHRHRGQQRPCLGTGVSQNYPCPCFSGRGGDRGGGSRPLP
jgi:hypothetical protein